jgi:hypothetical protein
MPVRSQVEEKAHAKAVARANGAGQSIWNELTQCLLEVSDETCGRRKGWPRHMET